ncbi:MAG TPA: AraC family transcriptional regulator [Thermoanaerobaculia bacterium]|nr:AraC family transcriptional regulator [Thermoanaerobaculia bacterium]
MSSLAIGQYFGRVPRSWSAESLHLSPVIHDRQRINPSHAHEAAFITLMLGGEYTEMAGRHSLLFDRYTAIYHPAGLDHRDVIGGSGVRLLLFEFHPTLLDGVEHDRAGMRSMRDLSGSRAAFDLLTLYRRAMTDDDEFGFESAAVELIARLTPQIRAPQRGLPSLRRAREYLHAHFRDRLTVQEVARAAGVHPVYLGQAFRREFGETIGEAVMRLRVRAAAEQLSSTGTPLAVVACDHGFCDQSHLHRAFRKLSGVTPLQFRHTWRDFDSLPPR